jgi:hypothetical protein
MHNSCPGRGAAFFMPLRRAGTQLALLYHGPRLCSAPLREELRAALRPGNESYSAAICLGAGGGLTRSRANSA